MSDHIPEASKEATYQVDETVRRISENVSQTTSRRGFLATLGRAAFATLGVSVVTQILPVGRDAAKAATYNCNVCILCGFCGTQCGCANCSGDYDKCPTCACNGGWWEACCTCGSTFRYRYRDCFSHGDSVNGPCGTTKINNCQSCAYCCPSSHPAYSGNCWGQYMCTRVINLGLC